MPMIIRIPCMRSSSCGRGGSASRHTFPYGVRRAGLSILRRVSDRSCANSSARPCGAAHRAHEALPDALPHGRRLLLRLARHRVPEARSVEAAAGSSGPPLAHARCMLVRVAQCTFACGTLHMLRGAQRESTLYLCKYLVLVQVRCTCASTLCLCKYVVLVQVRCTFASTLYVVLARSMGFSL